MKTVDDRNPQEGRKPRGEGSDKAPRLGLFIVLAVIMFLMVGRMWDNARNPKAKISDVYAWIDQGRVESAVISRESVIVGIRKDAVEEGGSKSYKAQIDEHSGKQLVEDLHAWNREQPEDRRIAVDVDTSGEAFSQLFLFFILPLVLLGALFWFFLRRMGPPQGVMNFGKSKAKIYAEKEVHVTFDEVAGVPEAVEEVKEIVEFLREPKKFHALGARIPKGVLFLGAPGTGKTLLAARGRRRGRRALLQPVRLGLRRDVRRRRREPRARPVPPGGAAVAVPRVHRRARRTRQDPWQLARSATTNASRR